MFPYGQEVVIVAKTRDEGKTGIVQQQHSTGMYTVKPKYPKDTFVFDNFFESELAPSQQRGEEKIGAQIVIDDLTQFVIDFAKSEGVEFPDSWDKEVSPSSQEEKKVASHKQVTVPTFVQCDEGIAPLIFAMSAMAGIHTHFSCQGDKNEADPRAWVTFTTSRRKLFRLIRHLQDGQEKLGVESAGWEIHLDAGKVHTLFVEPKYIAEISNIITAFCGDF